MLVVVLKGYKFDDRGLFMNFPFTNSKIFHLENFLENENERFYVCKLD